MFDWDDEELANIILGEAGQSDDHIVPYPEAGDLWNQEDAKVKLTEQKTPGAKIDLHGRKLGSFSIPNNEGISASGFGMGSWAGLSSSNADKNNHDSLGTEVSKCLSDTSKYGSSRAETAQLKEDAKISHNTNEGKDEGDFVDYSWAHIGSFDDLDQILSNVDPVFGHVNLDNADELWYTPKDVSNSVPTSLKSSSSGALRNKLERFDAQFGEQEESYPLNYGKLSAPAPCGLPNLHVEYVGGRTKIAEEQQMNQVMLGKTIAAGPRLASKTDLDIYELTEKASWQENLLKSRKKLEGELEVKMSQDFYGSWTPSVNMSGQFQNQLAPFSAQSSPAPGQQSQFQRAVSLQHQNITNPFVTPSLYGDFKNTYPSVPMLSQLPSGELNSQALTPTYEVSLGKPNSKKKSVDSPLKPLTMTPQEKIEKLRRRQQMQAMIAIQKQQQQFDHQVSCTNIFVIQRRPEENQNPPCDGNDLELEYLNGIHALDSNPLPEEDANTVSVAADDCSMKDSILFRLQGIILKLDIKTRLCMRDSLFRLAQSTMQRQHVNDTSSTNRVSRDELEVGSTENSISKSRYSQMPAVETETNPIDRTVAHLLFHRPMESIRNNLETLDDSPISTIIPCNKKAAGLVNLPMGCFPDDDMRSKQQLSDQGFKNSCPSAEVPVDQHQNGPCMDISENAS